MRDIPSNDNEVDSEREVDEVSSYQKQIPLLLLDIPTGDDDANSSRMRIVMNNTHEDHKYDDDQIVPSSSRLCTWEYIRDEIW